MASILKQFALLCFLHLVASQNSTNSTADVLTLVNQLIGTDNGGNVFAGATRPYGMAKAVADVDGQNTAGFSTDGSNVTGFSHMHDSGTGGNPSLGNFPLFPQVCPGDEIDNCKFQIAERKVPYVGSSVKATPGYFSLELSTGISAEMTVTEHAALYHFTFPSSSASNGTSPVILLDLTDLSASRQNASISIDSNGRMKGNGTFIPSFGSGSFVSYFCADFQGASIKDNGIWVNARAGSEPKEISVTRGINLFYLESGGWIQFDRPANGVVSARVGVSFASADQACSNAENEISGDEWDFAGIKKGAEDAWRDKLNVVSIDAGGASQDLQTGFYSAIYRTMMSPQNYTGENPLWQSSEPYYDSFYWYVIPCQPPKAADAEYETSIWDAFRSQLPFLTIVDPITLTSMVRSLLDTYKHVGWLPDCRMSLCKGFTQGGSNADVVLTDAYVKNLTSPDGPIDWELAYEAVLNDAENEPLDWSVEGRGGLQSWKRLNYIPALDYDYLGFGTNSRSISRTLEYSYDDYCLATLAKGLGKDDDYTKYLSRATNWQNLWKDDTTSSINGQDTGFRGFFQPKYLNGTWGYQDPILCSPLDSFCSLTSNPQETFEDSIWEYQFYVPHAIPELIDLFGGPTSFLSRLDFLHTSGLTDIGNEPSFLTVFLPHYAGRPGLSSELVHKYIPSYFNSTPTGLPGNDDTGAMASFSAFCMMGLFPNPGQNIYFISAPFFASISVTSPVTGKTATIKTSNFDAGYERIYVQNATLDGLPYTRNWIDHSFFTEGKTLVLTVAGEEGVWGQKAEDAPPGMSASASGRML
ncbi:putative secreted glycosidase [Lachnellula subtilissima]|uniref:Putative secreted glycosidase n=1 Tax=Lachnellula subtilissima TaxID=602034 RepID=A0A8H8U932_9HELO|nr:putative secreted glycosidase [Lachnellula subtilissima]